VAGRAALVIVDRTMTFTYFIPTMLKLMRDESPPDPRAVTTALRWVKLGYVLTAATLFAWIAALKALSLLDGHVS
jgi:hypothetical protein